MKLSEAVFAIIDVETTGLNPAVDRVVEIGVVTLYPDRTRGEWGTIIDPGIPIPAIASAVNHLTDLDVAGCKPIEEVTQKILDFISGAVIVAHNAHFDQSFLPMIRNPWLCTKRLAMHLWPHAPGYSNQVLRYWLKIDIETGPPHRALSDALVTAEIFLLAAKEYLTLGHPDDIDAILAYAASPVYIEKIPF